MLGNSLIFTGAPLIGRVFSGATEYYHVEFTLATRKKELLKKNREIEGMAAAITPLSQ
jgi:hypothetical protein